MSKHHRSAVMIMGILAVVCVALSLSAQGKVLKIKVIVENASIRLNPSLDSEAIEENIALDTVFTAEKKVGEWYEVKFQSQLGVTLVGYVHEMYVEVMPDTEAQPVPETEPAPVEPERRIPPPVSRGALDIRFGVRLGGMIAALQPGYTWQYSFLYADEDFVIRDSVANASGFGFDAELGVFIIPFVEVTAGFSLASKGLTGTYGLEVPNQFLWSDIASDTATSPVDYSVTMLNFGLNFYPLPEGRISPFIGLGGSLISSKMVLMEDITYRDTYYSNWTHTIEIQEVQMSEEKLSKFGFYFRGGLKVLITPNIYVFAQGKYILAKVKVEHLLSAFIDDLDALDINLGGLFAGLGVGVLF